MMVKEQKRLVKLLGEDTLMKDPNVYVAYGIIESYATQMKHLTKSIDNSLIEDGIYNSFISVAGFGCNILDPNMPLALEDLCEEIVFYLDWCDRKIPVEEIPKEFKVGTATIYTSCDHLIIWG